jgi:hypothetical protein
MREHFGWKVLLVRFFVCHFLGLLCCLEQWRTFLSVDLSEKVAHYVVNGNSLETRNFFVLSLKFYQVCGLHVDAENSIVEGILNKIFITKKLLNREFFIDGLQCVELLVCPHKFSQIGQCWLIIKLCRVSHSAFKRVDGNFVISCGCARCFVSANINGEVSGTER